MKVLSDFVEAMKADIRQELEVIGHGNLKSYDEYRYRCGRLAGIEFTLTNLIDFIRKTPVEERN